MAKAKKKRTQADTHTETRARVVALLRRIIDTKQWTSIETVYVIGWWGGDSEAVADGRAVLCEEWGAYDEQVEAEALLADFNMLSVDYRGEDLEALQALRARWFRHVRASDLVQGTVPEPTLVLVARALRVLERDRLDERERKVLRLIHESPGSELFVVDIATGIRCHTDTAGPMLAALAKRGLVERSSERTPYRLTDAGRRALE